MTQQIINTGTGPDSYTGDTLRTAFTKVNDNFSQLYAGNVGGNITVANVTAGGNVTADYFFGDGSNLTGIVATSSYGDANVAAFLPYNSANVAGGYFIGNGALLTGIASSSSYGNANVAAYLLDNPQPGTYSNTNVASYLPTYSGNVNAAYFTGNGALLTGIAVSANLGNLSVGGATNQTLTGTERGSLIVKPYAGNAAVIQTEYDASGVVANLYVSSFGLSSIYVRTEANASGIIPNLAVGANAATVQMNAVDSTLIFTGNPYPSGTYTYNFSNGSLYSREFYTAANFPTGYQFNTVGGDTGISHEYVGNISLLRIRHDNAEVAKFYDNLTTVLSGNLVVSQSGNVFGTFPNAFIQTYSNINSYSQLVLQNINSGDQASFDVIVTADNGNDAAYFGDFGIASSNYNYPGFAVIRPDDVYMLAVGADSNGPGSSDSANLILGSTNGNIKMFVGAPTDDNVVATFSNTGLLPGANVTYDLGSSTNQWKDLWLSNSTMYLGGFPITVDDGTLSVNGSVVSGNYSNANVAAYLPTYTGNISATNGTFTTAVTARNLNADGGNISLNPDFGLIFTQSNAVVTANTQSWTFDTTGDLTLPNNGYLNFDGGKIVQSPTNTLGIVVQDPNNDLNSLDLVVDDGNEAVQTRVLLDREAIRFNVDLQGSNYAWTFDGSGTTRFPEVSGDQIALGGGEIVGLGNSALALSSNTSVVINTYNPSLSNWTFGNTGTLTVPGDYTLGPSGSSLLIAAPNTTDGIYMDWASEISFFIGNAGGENIAQIGTLGGVWAFNNDGTLTAPGNITSTTGNVLVKNIRTIDQEVHLGQGAGQTNQSANAVAIGTYAGQISQGTNSVAVGRLAGNSSQGSSSVAVGASAGESTQGVNSVAVGVAAAETTQGNASTALGWGAGQTNQGDLAVALGSGAAYNGQGYAAIAIGADTSPINQGQFSIAIGAGASTGSFQANNSVLIDATGTGSTPASAAGLYINPVRNDNTSNSNIVTYNTSSKELTYANTISINGYTVGYRDIPQVTFTSNATLSLSDAGKHYFSSNSANVITVPNNTTVSFSIGTAISIIQQGTANLTVTPDSGVTLYLAGNSTSSARTLGNYGMATLMKVGTDTWFINGTGVN